MLVCAEAPTVLNEVLSITAQESAVEPQFGALPIRSSMKS